MLLDVNLIAHLSKSIIAATGVDVKLIFTHIVKAYKNSHDIEAKRAMMLGAFYAGVCYYW